MKPKINDITLAIAYNINNTMLELESTSLDGISFQFSILGKDRNDYNDKTTVEFSNVKELEKIINHFKEECKKVNIK